MEWPESVHVDVLGSKKHSRKARGHKDAHNRYSVGQQEEQRRLRESFPFVPSGVILEAGSRGAASLKAVRLDEEGQRKRRKRGDDRPRKRWDWTFANDPTPDRPSRLRLHDDFAIFFPPTIQVDIPSIVEPEKTTAAPRSRASSRLSQRSSAIRSPKAAQVDVDDDGTSQSEGKKKQSQGSDDDEPTSPRRARRASSSETDDAAVPAGQQAADSLPTSTESGAPDSQQDVTNMLKVKQSQLHLDDNRNALATITYEAKVDPLRFGHDTRNMHFVAFAMGEKGNELNISLFKTFPSSLKKSTKMPVFVPSMQPSFICRDRILQISVSNKRRLKYTYICMAIRTESLLYFVLVTPINTSVFPKHEKPGEPVVRVDLLSVVDSEGLEGAKAVDISMHPTHFQQCLIATDTGVLYKWSMVRRRSPSEGWVHEGKLSRIMSIPDGAKFDMASRFYRAAWGTREGTALFVNASHAWFLDLENPAQLILNAIDLSATTSLFTSLDSSAVCHQAEFICLTTTEAVMWIDAHDGHVAMSWGHERQGENVQIESIATDKGSGSAFLLRSLYNSKGSCFHVHETVQGIQSRLDPYDIHLSDHADSLISARKSSSILRQIGFSSFIIPDAPAILSILMFLEKDGRLTCRIFDNRTPGGALSMGSDDKVEIRSNTQVITDVHPKDLLTRHVNFTTAIDDVESMLDDSGLDGMDVDEEEVDMKWPLEQDNADDSPYQCIRTRDLWKSLGQASLNESPIVSIASLRSLLNDPEQLSSTGVYTLHELLAISAETAPEDRQERPDSLKPYSLGLFPGNKQEQQQLEDLLEQSESVLNRLKSRKADLGNTMRKISGDKTIASSVGDNYDRFAESYLPIRSAAPYNGFDGKLRSMQDQSIAQLLGDLHLSIPTFALARTQETHQSGNEDQISETLSRLSFDAGTRKRLTAKQDSHTLAETSLSTVWNVLSQWELGTDPSTYIPPTLPETLDLSLDDGSTQLAATAATDYTTRAAVKLPRASLPSNSGPPFSMEAPPSPSAGASLPTFKNQSQVHFETDTQSQSQDLASTQIVPGPFGSRNAPSFRRSLGKKRTIGF